MRASLATLVCVATTSILGSSALAQVTFPTNIPIPPLPGLPMPSPPSSAPTKTAKIVSSKNEGELRLSAGVGVDASGGLFVSMAAIKHPDMPSVPVNPLLASVSFNAHLAGALALTCSIGGVSASSRAPVDVVFVNDTTGSMSGTVNGIDLEIRATVIGKKVYTGSLSFKVVVS